MSELSAQPNAKPSFFRGFIQGKTRITLAWIFSLLLILSAREYPVWEGILVAFVGATLRFWASGYLYKDNQVSVGGPYAYVRNPLYLGTFCMALGTAIAIDQMWLALFVSVVFGLLYHFIILDEETKLKKMFGEPYELYLKTVPRFIPRILPLLSAQREKLLAINPQANLFRFSWQAIRKNKAWEAYAAFAALMGFVTLIAWAWQSLN